MDDDRTEVDHFPAGDPGTFLASLFVVLRTDLLLDTFGKRIQHSVTGAGTDDKVIGKGNNILQVQQDDILPLFILQRVYNFAGKFERIQVSPHGLVNGAENNFV